MRPGPKPKISSEIIGTLRQAIIFGADSRASRS
jgi:hypothetical protein